ncbi:MAG: peptidoglycan-binding protein [Pseudomonadota bacterium]|uniref:peptidoglycan-binding protein n=1 Tax=Roseovarius salincola TaxID=2978479 RepID=UPI0022A82A63|nr:peptidoglycan-binding protein [Roseovarius sp. EGI FJ00037]MCZ0814303.1 peptidoglycan-binding protein [Roseovarius sp. EGI FJ00037]
MLKRIAIFLTLSMGLHSTPVHSDSLNRILNGARIINEADRILRRGQGNAQTPSTAQNPQRSEPRVVQQPSMSRQDIREIQSLLSQAGYDPGPADGIMGGRTRDAITAFQRDNGMQATGRPSTRLQDDLRWAAAQNPVQKDRRTSSSGPSFDCGRASTPTEFAICGSPDLAELDRAIARNYSAAMSGADSRTEAQIKNSQKAWLSQRNSCGADVQCLVNSMAVRSQNLAVVASKSGGRVGSDETRRSQGEDRDVARKPDQEPGPTVSEADIFIAYMGGYLNREWKNNSRGQNPTDTVKSLVGTQLLGTELEGPFLASFPLSEWEIRDALARADVQPSRTLDLMLSKGQITSLLRLREFSRIDQNEFARRRVESELRKTLIEKVRASAREAVDVTLVCSVNVGDYDFDRQLYPLDPGDIERCFEAEPNAVGNVAGLKVKLPIEAQSRPEAFPIDPTSAEKIVERIGGTRFAIAMPATLRGHLTEEQNGRPALRITATVTGPIELRSAFDLTEVLYRFSESDLRDVDDTPEARRLSDLDRAWWLENADEVAVIAARAQQSTLDDLAKQDFFSGETGLKFAFRANYDDELARSGRSLSDFVHLRNRDLDFVARALGLPLDAIIHTAVPAPSSVSAFDSVILLLPQSADAYPVDQALPAYENRDGGRPFSNLEITVTAEHIVTMPDGSERLVLAGHPRRLVIRRAHNKIRWQDAPEIAHVVFSETQRQDYESVDLAWQSDLILNAQEFVDLSPEEIIQQQVENSWVGGSDAFAKRAAATELLELSRDRAKAPSAPWVKAGIRMDAYDFNREGWPVRSISLTFNEGAPEADRAMSLTAMSDAKDRGIFIPALPDVAQNLQNNSESFPKLDALMSIRVTGIDTSYGSNLGQHITLLYTPVEVVLFDAGRSQLVIEDEDVLLRHRYAEPEVIAQSQDDATDGIDVSISSGSFSILDVAIGDDFQASVDSLSRRIGADMRYQATLEGRQEYVKQNNVGSIESFAAYHSAILLEASGKKELVAIYHEAPGLEDTVTAVSRTRIFPEGGGPTWKQLRTQLMRTYETLDTAALPEDGQPTNIEIWDWPQDTDLRATTSDQRTCMRSVMTGSKGNASAMVRDKKKRTQGYFAPVDTRAAWFDENGDATVPPVASPLSLPMLFGDAAECPDHEVMVLALSYGADGRIVEFRQAISNPAAINRIAEKQREDGAEVQSTEAEDFDL